MSFNAPVSGMSLPSARYVNSISETFPNPNRSYKVETGIIGRYTRDHLPINSNLTNGSVSDNYVEFILNSNQQEFIDCNSFVMEMKIRILAADGKPVTDTSNVTVIDGVGHRILSRYTLFLNGVPCESNSYFGLYNNINTYMSMSKASLSSSGMNMYYRDSTNESVITGETFKNQNNLEKVISNQCNNTLHMMTPLQFNISSSNFYLLNGVDIRLRFDMAPAKLIINSSDVNNEYSYAIDSVKLWSEKIIPDPSAMISLNKSLIEKNQVIEYIHERPVIKNFVFPAGQSSLSLDNIFNGVIPHTIHMVFLKQTAVNGVYNVNGAHFSNCNLSSLRMEINGNTHSAMTCSFPNEVTNIFHHTLSNLKSNKHLLTLQSFKNGKTIHCWDLRNSDCIDVLNIERSGNVRISFQTDKPLTENYFVFIIGTTTGLIEIDGSRRVKTSYIM